MTSQNILTKTSSSSQNADVPRIYIGCLTSYNCGFLHGKWIEANKEPDEIRAEIAEMLADPSNPCRKQYPQETYEEFAIHDYEGFGSICLSESHDIEEVSALANLIGENNSEIVSAAFDHVNSVDDIEEFIEENYAGTFESLEDFAYDFLDSCGDLNQLAENLRPYFDMKAYARDLEYGGDIFSVDLGHQQVAVFWNH